MQKPKFCAQPVYFSVTGTVAVVLALFAACPASALQDVSGEVKVQLQAVSGGGFVRGDCNQDGGLDVADAICSLETLFNSRPASCVDAIDANDDGQINIADPITLLSYLFQQGSPLPSPFPSCGPDPTADQLPAECRHAACPGGGENDVLVSLANHSNNALLAPLIAVVTSIQPNGVELLNPDGLYHGMPFVSYTSDLVAGTLAPGAETPEKRFSFSGNTPVTFTVKVYANYPSEAGWLPGDDPIGEQTPPPDRNVDRVQPDSVAYRIHTPGISFQLLEQNKQVFHALRVKNGGLWNVPGAPGIPTFSQLVAIPHLGDMKVEIEEGKGTTYQGIHVYPTQLSPEDNEEAKPPPFVMDEKLYATDNLYPQNLLVQREVEFRGVRLAVLQVALARTNPRSRELIFYPHLQVRVSFSGGPNKKPADYVDPGMLSPFSASVLEVEVLNSSVFLNVDASSLIHDRVERYFYDLLIVAPRDFESEAEELAEWKRFNGFATRVAYTDDIGDTAAEIETYIHTQYRTRGIEYLILFGDAEHIPPHYKTHHPTAHNYTLIGTDLYYATMGGAGDLVPDLAMGRIPASTAEEAALVVEKIKTYESWSSLPSDFYQRAIMGAYFQDNDHNGVADRIFAETSERIFQFLEGAGYEPERVYTTNSTDPRWWHSGDPIPAHLRKPGFPWDGDTADIQDAINDGAFLVTHRDHGSRYGWDHPYFSTSSIAALANGELLPVIFSINCQSGWFDNETDDATLGTTTECFAERFLLKEDGGAVAVVAATRNSRSWYNDEFIVGMIDCIWPQMLPDYPTDSETEANELAGSRELGWVINYGKMRTLFVYPSEIDGYGPGDNPDNITAYQRLAEIFHLLGDPTLRIKTHAPLWVSTRLKAILPGLPSIQWSFPRELSGARIAVLQGGIVRGQGVVSGEEGTVFFPEDSPLFSGPQTEVIVNREGYLPYRAPVSFVEPACTLYCLQVPEDPAGATAIAPFAIWGDGSFQPLGQIPLRGTGRQMTSVCELVGTRKYLFAPHNSSGNIDMMEFLSGGGLQFVGSPAATKGQRPSFLAVNPSGTRLLASTADDLIELFEIGPDGLKARGAYSVEGFARDVEIHATGFGEFAYVVSMGQPKAVYAYRLLEGGLEPIQTVSLEQLTTGRPYQVVATARNHLFVRDLDEGIFAFTIDAKTGQLSLVKGSPFPAGDFTTSFVVTRSGKYLYVAVGGQKPTIAAFRIDSDGSLALIAHVAAPRLTMDLVPECGDTVLYAASRGENLVMRWKIEADGTLTPIGQVPAGDTQAVPASLFAGSLLVR